MNFRLTKGNFLKTGAYIEGDSAVFTFAAEKEDECSIVLLDKSGNTACVIDIPAEYSTGSLYSVRLHDFCGNEYAYYFRINGKRCIDPMPQEFSAGRNGMIKQEVTMTTK